MRFFQPHRLVSLRTCLSLAWLIARSAAMNSPPARWSGSPAVGSPAVGSTAANRAIQTPNRPSKEDHR
ncbi:unnamed protein product [Penicillium roqueforti FM164]|uniref:Secreted protein n=1 Tax=Penicillium roqueforti (strain FM164) TaxID=1365484 RepID=W6QQF6_PENRF|nr:unnamed protein product [Penicillium roqueforti FM164]